VERKSLYNKISTVAFLIGAGMILGHNFSNGTSNNGLWIGGLLIVLAAVVFGMSLSSPKNGEGKESSEQKP